MQGTGTTTSIWMKAEGWPGAEADDAGDRAEIAVIGGGIAGLTTAYLLQGEGRDVLVLTDGPIGGGETSRTTAHLSNAIDDRFAEIERVHGVDGIRLAAESHGAAIDRIEQIANAEGIDCGFRRVDGYLVLAEGDDESLIEDELKAAHRAGLGDVVRVDAPPATGFGKRPALRFPRQARIHALDYLAGLARAFMQRGGRIATGKRVSSVESGRPATLHLADGGRVVADVVACCTNAPIVDHFAIHTKQAPYRTYAVGLETPKGSVPDALYWDTLDPYHYVRLQEEDGHDVLIVGGEDHKTGQAYDMAARYGRLEDWARRYFPECGETLYRWSGQVFEPFDGLAFIGRDPGGPDNVLIATGDSGMGMTHGTIAGMLLTDLAMGRENGWAALYDPTRKQTGRVGVWLRENLNVARQMADHLRPGEVADAADIAPGSGAVMREGMDQLAVYRDENSQLHRLSAVCPHLKCIVHWNPGEKTWDCPCHGSRFSATGKVVAGPAHHDLSRR